VLAYSSLWGRALTARQIYHEPAFIMKRFAAIALLLVVAAVLAVVSFEVVRVSKEIQQESLLDEAQPADAIIVLGAAEYRGKPSPVLEARLNHALFLYLMGLAPRVITTGGAGGDPVFTEGSVGRAYLTQRGVPPEAIVVEREGESTAQSVAAVAEIMRRMNLRSAIVVSDGYHIFRVKKMLESSGLKVYGSPRPSISPGEWRARWQDIRQAVGYLLWKIGIAV
jgi:uncharacterized SAM-binding protein YcdF (DUF218 family)